MGLFSNKYPYTDFHEMNLDFILETINKLSQDMSDFIKYNEIKFHDPIEWDITTQYTSNTVVTNEGVAYLSKQAVPTGINIDNDLYWLPIGIFNVSIDTFRSNITVYNEVANNRSSRNYDIGNIIWWHDNLYYVIDEIVTGDALSSNNLSLTTVADELYREINERKNAINEVNDSLADEKTERDEAIATAIQAEVTDRNEAINSAIDSESADRDIAINAALTNLKIGDLKNVNATFPVNGQVLKYDQASATWVNANESGGGSADLSIIAAEYNAETVYKPNDIVIYLGTLYKKINSTESGIVPTNINSWVSTTISNELTELYTENKYSTDETLIGTYVINGVIRKIYRKILIPVNTYTALTMQWLSIPEFVFDDVYSVLSIKALYPSPVGAANVFNFSAYLDRASHALNIMNMRFSYNPETDSYGTQETSIDPNMIMIIEYIK